jgi:Ca2+-binding RTX toxin-like protein
MARTRTAGGLGLFAGAMGLLAAILAPALALPSFAAAKATISRHGNSIVLTSDSASDSIHSAGTNYLHVISFYVERGHVLRAGHGCHRLHGHHETKVVVACGAPSLHENSLNHVTMTVNLGAGNDTFVADPWDDVQPRIVAEGGPGNDTIYGSTNADEIHGGEGDDKIFGLDGPDNLYGGEGDDMVVGGPGDDAISGEGGVDNLFGDEVSPIPNWGNDTIISALDFTPDFSGFFSDHVSCGGGPYDAAIVDAGDNVDADCEVLSGGQTSPPMDIEGQLPLAIVIGEPAPTPGGFARIVRGQPIRSAVTFSAPATVEGTLIVSHHDAHRLHLPGPVIARGIGTPLTVIPITIDTEMRLLWRVRPHLKRLHRLHATLKIVGTTADGASTTATRPVVLH